MPGGRLASLLSITVGRVFVALQDHVQTTVMPAHHINVTKTQRRIPFGGSSGKASGGERSLGVLTVMLTSQVGGEHVSTVLSTPTASHTTSSGPLMVEQLAHGWRIADDPSRGSPPGPMDGPHGSVIPLNLGAEAHMHVTHVHSSTQLFSQILCNP